MLRQHGTKAGAFHLVTFNSLFNFLRLKLVFGRRILHLLECDEFTVRVPNTPANHTDIDDTTFSKRWDDIRIIYFHNQLAGR